jgi:hypothetical protein
MDVDGRIRTLTSDEPAKVEVGDQVTLAGFERDRPFACHSQTNDVTMRISYS